MLINPLDIAVYHKVWPLNYHKVVIGSYMLTKQERAIGKYTWTHCIFAVLWKNWEKIPNKLVMVAVMEIFIMVA